MCGVAGIVSARSAEYADRLERMVDALTHRGPDDRSTLALDGCVLGHTRLSIVDIEGGAQPMTRAAEGHANTIVFNGEIYGYREIRKQLTDQRFRTTSDTEVILALYERHGSDVARHLPGMFAFALWDAARRELVCARDRFGEKPLYYATADDGTFLFASEIKALLASGLVDPVLSRSALAHYLRRLYVHPHRTIYENVHVLPPAHRLVFAEGRASVSRYWTLPAPGPVLTLADAVERFRALFEQAVERQLVADVPVAAFLSGGADSSSVVTVAAAKRVGLKTIAFGFTEERDERPFARQVAQQNGTEHVELASGALALRDLLEEMQRVYDEPFADSSNIPTWLLSRAAREHTKVALTGDGGDELLAGYDFWYRPLLAMEQARGAAGWKEPALRTLGFLARLLRLRALRRRCLESRRGIDWQRRFGSVRAAHTRQVANFNAADLEQLGFDDETLRSSAGPGPEAPTSDTLDDALRMDLADYLPGDILAKTDRASMAHGLELRAPFLDVDLASFLIALPARLKLDRGEDKILLRRAYESRWPAAIRSRPKRGFEAPVATWLRTPELATLSRELLADRKSRIFDVLPHEATTRCAARGGTPQWILLVLALWLQQRDIRIGTP